MKTIGRIIIILVAFAIVMGLTYAAVSTGGSSSTNMPPFETGERLVRPGGQLEGRPDRHEGGAGGGLMLGLIKNLGIVAVVTALIAVPRNLMRNKKSVPAVAG